MNSKLKTLKMKDRTKDQLLKEIKILQKENAKLLKDKEYSQLIAENIHNSIAITTFDLKAKFLYVNPSVKQVFGYDPKDMVGKSFFDFIRPNEKKTLLPILKKYLSNIIKKVFRIDDPNLFENIEFHFKAKDGSWHHLQSTINIIGKNLLAVTRDITASIQKIEILTQSELYLTAINKATTLLLHNSDIPYQEFVDIIGKASKASRTYIFINGKSIKGELLTSQIAEYCVSGINPEIDNQELQNLPFSKWVPRWEKTLSEGNIIAGNVAEFPSNEREILEPQGIKSILIIPIIIDDKFWGFIGFDNCEDVRKWSETEQSFLETAAKNLKQEIIRCQNHIQLEAENIRFQTTLDSIDATIYVSDIQTYELLFLNKLGKELTGENVGKKCYLTLQKGQTKPCSFCTNHLLLDENGKPKESYVWEFKNTITNRWYECHDTAISWTDGRLVRLEIATDITDKKEIELTLKKQTSELIEHNIELDDFSHTVAHDLKNPLSQITGFAKLIQDDFDNLKKDTIHEYINKIVVSSNRTDRIINSLLLLSNVRKSEVQKEELNMATIVSESLDRLSQTIEKFNSKIILPSVWPTTLGNHIWIEEVWVNYIINAIKYGGEPPIVEIGYDIETKEKGKGEIVRFWVRDNGNGISEDDQRLLFKKFERLDQAETQGYGLGLSIVQRIIEKLNGEVGLESTIGNGSIFYFTLPLSKNNKKDKTLTHDSVKLKSNVDIQENNKITDDKLLKILIVEDEDTSHNLFTIVIKPISRETLHAISGKEAIKICKQNPDIDLIIMDIQIPIIDGYEATREIRKFNSTVKIIAQTAYPNSSYSADALEAGCNIAITKPINIEELMGIIKELLD